MPIDPVEFGKSDYNRTQYLNPRPRTTFWKHPETGILIPRVDVAPGGDMTFAQVEAALYAPFTNDLGKTKSFIVAFMEALRVAIKDSYYSFITDPDGRNDYCPLYSGLAVELLRIMGISAGTVEVANRAYYPSPVVKMIADACEVTLLGVGSEEWEAWPPRKIAVHALRLLEFSQQKTPWQENGSVSLEEQKKYLQQVFDPDKVNGWHDDEIEGVFKIARMMDGDYARYWQKVLSDFLEEELPTVSFKPGHQVAGFILDGVLYILDINQDQNQHPVLNRNAHYTDPHFQKYGINPLRDAPLLLPANNAMSHGYFPDLLPDQYRQLFSVDPSPQSDLPTIFRIMRSGVTIWDKNHSPSGTLRATSEALIEARRSLSENFG